MEERIVEIEIKNGDLSAALDKVKVLIMQDLKALEKDDMLFDKAIKSYNDCRADLISGITSSFKDKDPEGEELAQLIFACGFRQGYLTAEADEKAAQQQCCKASCD